VPGPRFVSDMAKSSEGVDSVSIMNRSSSVTIFSDMGFSGIRCGNCDFFWKRFRWPGICPSTDIGPFSGFIPRDRPECPSQKSSRFDFTKISFRDFFQSAPRVSVEPAPSPTEFPRASDKSLFSCFPLHSIKFLFPPQKFFSR
jgi:hypothetical protein